MLQAALGSIILLIIYKFMDTENEYEIDWWMTFTFILVPALLLFLIQIGLAFLHLPQLLILFGYILYFLVPFLMLKKGLGFATKVALKYSVIVPVVVIVAEIPFYFLLSASNA